MDAAGLEGSYSHDAGKVVAGEIVSHAFEFTNITDEAIAIRSDADIRRDCGCSGVVPDLRELNPGSSTNVVVTVHTKLKRGPFRHGGTVSWSAPSGKQVTASYSVRGDAQEAVECNPPWLDWTPADVSAGVNKELNFTANVALDWAKAKLSATDSVVRVVDWHASGDRGVCKLRCAVPDDVETANGVVVRHGNWCRFMYFAAHEQARWVHFSGPRGPEK